MIQVHDTPIQHLVHVDHATLLRIYVRSRRYAGAVTAYLPPGWPSGVHPPDSEEFEQTAVTWLLDVVPPDYRLHGVLRRHPVALAVLARHHIAACVRGAREGYRSARTELSGKLPPGGMEAVLEEPYLLLYEKKISAVADLVPVMEKVAKTGRPVVLIAEDMDEVALLEPDRDQDVSGRGTRKQQMPNRHGRHCPEREQEA